MSSISCSTCFVDWHQQHAILAGVPKQPIIASFPPFQINAMANRAAGKGYENEANYENIKFQFLGIENIHTMRTSLQKVIECKCVVTAVSNQLIL